MYGHVGAWFQQRMGLLPLAEASHPVVALQASAGEAWSAVCRICSLQRKRPVHLEMMSLSPSLSGTPRQAASSHLTRMQPVELVEDAAGASWMCSTRKVPGTFEGEWQIYQPHNVPRRGGRINTRNVVSAISEVPLVLWESGYLMMRWLEHKAMTSRIFRSLAFCSSSHIVRKLMFATHDRDARRQPCPRAGCRHRSCCNYSHACWSKGGGDGWL